MNEPETFKFSKPIPLTEEDKNTEEFKNFNWAVKNNRELLLTPKEFRELLDSRPLRQQYCPSMHDWYLFKKTTIKAVSEKVKKFKVEQ